MIWAIEKNTTVPPNQVSHNGRVIWTQGDWLNISAETVRATMARSDCYSIVCNPPYSPAPAMLEHVAHALAVGAEYVAALLPLVFLESRERSAFNLSNPPTGLYPLARRPKFVGAGGQQGIAWFVWRRPIGKRAQRIQVIP
jgi:hypothetical protein